MSEETSSAMSTEAAAASSSPPSSSSSSSAPSASAATSASSSASSATATATVSSKFATARELKEKGNQLFKAGDFKGALSKYTKVYAYIDGLKVPEQATAMAQTQNYYPGQTSGVSPAEAAEIAEINESTSLNIAQCYIKINDGERALKFANKALTVKETVKAFYRRGLAHLLLNDTDAARSDLHKAQNLFISQNEGKMDPSIQSALKKADEQDAAHELKMKKQMQAALAREKERERQARELKEKEKDKEKEKQKESETEKEKEKEKDKGKEAEREQKAGSAVELNAMD